MYLRSSFILIGIFGLIACRPIVYADMSYEMKSYNNLPFRTDGYYYYSNYSKYDNDSLINVQFFYKNGVNLHYGNSSYSGITAIDKLLDLENKLLDTTTYRLSKERLKDHSDWSVFIVDGQRLFMESYIPAIELGNIKNTFKYSNTIENDTVLISGYGAKWLFRQFDYKPDSSYCPLK